MSDVLGTARLDLVVGTEQMDAAIDRAKSRISGMSQEAQAEYAKLNTAEKKRVDSLINQANQLGKTRQEQILYNAALRGTPTNILNDLKSKLSGTAKPAADMAKSLRDSGVAAKEAGKQLNQYGVSAKQQAAALRGVPAQVTDIVTALAGGQRPLTVLLQQGGQLKDMFGGVVPAARALGGAISGLITPLTLTAGAVFGLAAAWNAAEQRAAEFNKAIDLTGNFAGTTADDLAAMADSLDASTSATAGKASQVLAQVAATGKFTREQMEEVAKAAILMETATGRSIEQTVRDFASLKDDPLDAILKLNDAIGDGTNVVQFLTPATAKLIEKLKEQGDSAGATQAAIDALYDAISTRAPKAAEDVGLVEGAFRGLKRGVVKAFDEVVSGFGKADRAAKHGLQSLGAYFSALQSGPAGAFSLQALSTGAGSGSTALPKPNSGRVINTAEEKEALSLKDRYLTREEQKKKAIAELDRLSAHYTKEQYNQIKAGIEERFKPPKGSKSGNGIESATSRAAIQAFEDELKKEQGLIVNQTQILEANYAARNITVEKYYAEQKRLAQENTAAQTHALEGEVAALQSRALKGKDSINNSRELAEKEAELAKARADGAAKLEILNIQEAANLKQRQFANLAYKDALDQNRDALAAELDSQVLRISVGEKEFEIRQRIIQLYRDEAKELLALARQRDAGEIDPDTYKERVTQLRSAIEEEVSIVKDGYRRMDAAQRDWANGARKAFADYSDAANDVAGQTYTIFTDAIHGLEDVLTEFITKGKADWKGFFDGIAAEITRFVVRQQLNKIIKKFIPGMADGQGDQASALSGAAGQLAASAGPLLSAAAALSASAAALAAAGAGSAAAGSGGEGASGSTFGSFFSAIFGGGWGGIAKGKAFDGPVTAFANGGVVGSPHFFASGGKLGLMGEAGPEAILPLHRGPDGKLGVRMEAANDGPRVMNNNVTFYLPERYTRQTQGQIAQETNRVQNRFASRNR